ncbi:MAG TPA: 50S ribosomal protein L23 [Candidatus Moranbacteria bacterium]|nr:50S ribosomal protein L23 [Candidatus Moranbacteria bacterium]
MGLFGKKKKEENQQKDSDKVEKKTIAKKSVKSSADDNKKKKAKSKKNEPLFISETADVAYRFIVKPWITEKTQNLIADNKYVFKVRQKTKKESVKEAIEKLYGVDVEKVNMVNIPSKKKRFGRVVGKRSALRKAVVTVKKGQKIEIFE